MKIKNPVINTSKAPRDSPLNTNQTSNPKSRYNKIGKSELLTIFFRINGKELVSKNILR